MPASTRARPIACFVAHMAEPTSALGRLAAARADLSFRNSPNRPDAPYAEAPDRPSARCVLAERLVRLVRQQSQGGAHQGWAVSKGPGCGDLDHTGLYRSDRGRSRQCKPGGGRAACFGGWRGSPRSPETSDRTLAPPIIDDRELFANREIRTITARGALRRIIQLPERAGKVILWAILPLVVTASSAVFFLVWRQ